MFLWLRHSVEAALPSAQGVLAAVLTVSSCVVVKTYLKSPMLLLQYFKFKAISSAGHSKCSLTFFT